jgi:pimeloyl-ACP methyl ester carboxylesterase
LPRLLGLLALNAAGVKSLNSLPVTRFALSDQARTALTAEYGFCLALNFAPNHDFMMDIRSSKGRVAVLAGSSDEASYTEKLESIVRSADKSWPVTLLPGIGHIPSTLDPVALEAIVKQVKQLQHQA